MRNSRLWVWADIFLDFNADIHQDGKLVELTYHNRDMKKFILHYKIQS